MKILNLEEIKQRIDLDKIIVMQEEGFRAYSEGKVNVPPVGYLKIDHTSLSYHLKYGIIQGDSVFVIKCASGFEQSPGDQLSLAIPSQELAAKKPQGMMIVIDSNDGRPLYLLQDEGYLTQLRTAVAGLITAKVLGPKKIQAIGVLGTGHQARLQINMLKDWTNCRTVYLWGRDSERTIRLKNDLNYEGFTVYCTHTPGEVAKNCHLIITTTASLNPLLKAADILPGTHITAVGADAPGKQELDPLIFQKADIIVADSKKQCIDHGELHYAYQLKLISDAQILELGQIIADPALGRSNEDQITVTDLTGVAIQDIQIAKAVIN